MSDQSLESTSENISLQGTNSQIQVPYEAALNKAFDKLNSQILIFLLAYLVLIIGLNITTGSIPESIVNLLYMIPLLGIIAYGWSRKRTIVQDPSAKGIKIQAFRVSGQGYVAGRSGGQANTTANEDIQVSVGLVSNRARVVGQDLQVNHDLTSQQVVVSDLFSSLNPSLQREAIRFMMSLADRQDTMKDE